MSRNNDIQYILEKIEDYSDDIINKLYKEVYLYVNNNDDENDPKRIDKILYIQQHIKLIDEGNIKNIAKLLNKMINLNELNDKKLDIVLVILNKILKALNHDEIVDIADFKNITREDLLDPKCERIIIKNLDQLFNNGFKRSKYTMYDIKRNKIKNGHLTILRKILKEIGYILSSKTMCRMKNGERTYFCSYSIVKML